MTCEDLIERLEGVRKTGPGWMARCPAHEDRNPSLSLRAADDARILLHCHAGCSVQAICEAIGLNVSDLFPSKDHWSYLDRQNSRDVRQRSWRRKSSELRSMAEGLRLRAEAVLGEAKAFEITHWSDEELDIAMEAVGRAYSDLDRAETLEDEAFQLRDWRLTRERNHAAGSPAA